MLKDNFAEKSRLVILRLRTHFFGSVKPNLATTAHESGHVLTLMLNPYVPIKIDYVTIDPLSIAVETFGQLENGLVDNGRIAKDQKYIEAVLPTRKQDVMRAVATSLYGGAIAEKMLGHRFHFFGDFDDMAYARALASGYVQETGVGTEKELLKTAKETAADILARHKEILLLFTSELAARKTMHGPEIEKFFLDQGAMPVMPQHY